MQVGDLEVSYCTNIHPASGWDGVLANLRRYAPELKRVLSPEAPFALGLRLSDTEAEQLLRPGRLEQFRRFLDEEGLSVGLLNGFVHGGFHREVVKERVFAPDWRDPARATYTLRLLHVLGRLLPEGAEGGISTSPLSYKSWLTPGGADAEGLVVANLVRVVQGMARLHHQEGRLVHLDVEPEPGGLVETADEMIRFFHDRLLLTGAPALASDLGVSGAAAEDLLREHVRLCYDTCHFAVEFEDPVASIERLTGAGIRLGRLQVSSALEVHLPAEPAAQAELLRRLETFAESTYLHQVIEEEAGERCAYADLGLALSAGVRPVERRWRVHFHVPIFRAELGPFGSTQESIRGALRAVLDRRLTRHLEIETYTWEVLPAEFRQDLAGSILREYRWLLDELAAAAGTVG